MSSAPRLLPPCQRLPTQCLTTPTLPRTYATWRAHHPPETKTYQVTQTVLDIDASDNSSVIPEHKLQIRRLAPSTSTPKFKPRDNAHNGFHRQARFARPGAKNYSIPFPPSELGKDGVGGGGNVISYLLFQEGQKFDAKAARTYLEKMESEEMYVRVVEALTQHVQDARWLENNSDSVLKGLKRLSRDEKGVKGQASDGLSVLGLLEYTLDRLAAKGVETPIELAAMGLSLACKDINDPKEYEERVQRYFTSMAEKGWRLETDPRVSVNAHQALYLTSATSSPTFSASKNLMIRGPATIKKLLWLDAARRASELDYARSACLRDMITTKEAYIQYLELLTKLGSVAREQVKKEYKLEKEGGYLETLDLKTTVLMIQAFLHKKHTPRFEIINHASRSGVTHEELLEVAEIAELEELLELGGGDVMVKQPLGTIEPVHNAISGGEPKYGDRGVQMYSIGRKEAYRRLGEGIRLLVEGVQSGLDKVPLSDVRLAALRGRMKGCMTRVEFGPVLEMVVDTEETTESKTGEPTQWGTEVEAKPEPQMEQSDKKIGHVIQ